MNGRHPLVILGLWWLLAALIVVVGWCMLPAERMADAPPARLPVTVLPTATAQTAGPAHVKPTKTPQQPIILDLLPMTPTTREPTRTATPVPTETPVPPTPDRLPVQRG